MWSKISSGGDKIANTQNSRTTPLGPVMDFLDYSTVLFIRAASIGQLCEELNNTIGQGIWYQVRNTKWLCLVNDIVR